MAFSKNRHGRKLIAESTLKALENGSFILNSSTYIVPRVAGTVLYLPSDLSNWASSIPAPATKSRRCQITVERASTLEAASLLAKTSLTAPTSDTSQGTAALPKVGVLNFASATKPGGGFLSGANAQEESIARSSSIYPSLMSQTATEFYSSHKRDNRGCYYSHSIIWSPGVTIFRDDAGGWHEPYQIDVVTSPAVNAGVVRQRSLDAISEEKRIETVMRERMSRILVVFETRGVSRLVLGSFGTGVFQNSVPMVARLWAELLVRPNSRFAHSFEEVIFAIIDLKTLDEFKTALEETSKQVEEVSLFL
ncbi:hypothetical protein BU17DRAFT_41471 [Hysterangium stoloniferum]|nr:hypothetical protein BU17DRAFT_41471 [Hysterangium stoloniferum]